MVNYSFSMSELEYFLFVLVRVSAFIFVAPFFSTKGVPNNVKIGLSVFVTYIMYNFGPAHIYPEYNTIQYKKQIKKLENLVSTKKLI